MCVTFKDFYMSTSWNNPNSHLNVSLADSEFEELHPINLEKSPKLLYFFADYYVCSIEALTDDILDIIIIKEKPNLVKECPYLFPEGALHDIL